MSSKKLLVAVILMSLVGCAQKPSRQIITEDGQVSAVPASTLLEEAQEAIEKGDFRNADPLLQQLNFSARTPKRLYSIIYSRLNTVLDKKMFIRRNKY